MTGKRDGVRSGYGRKGRQDVCFMAKTAKNHGDGRNRKNNKKNLIGADMNAKRNCCELRLRVQGAVRAGCMAIRGAETATENEKKETKRAEHGAARKGAPCERGTGFSIIIKKKHKLIGTS